MEGRIHLALGEGARVERGGPPGDGRAEKVASIRGRVERTAGASVGAVGHLVVEVGDGMAIVGGEGDGLGGRRRGHG